MTTVGVLLMSSLLGAGYSQLRSAADARQRQAVVSARVQQELPRLEAFVATATGRPWKTQPRVTVLADGDFLDALDRSTGGADPKQPDGGDDDSGVTAAAMGLAPDPGTYWDAGSDATASHVTGFYDDAAGTLYVRGDTWSPIVETTVVHELVHANQDQAFDLSALTIRTRTDDESWPALQSVIEGEATLVERDYGRTRDEAWRRSVEDSDGQVPATALTVVETSAAFPYEVGSDFVEAVRDAGGTKAVARAFQHPPRWTRDLVDPKGWLAGTLPEVTIPPFPYPPSTPRGDVADIGVLGVEGLWLTVDSSRPRMSDFAELSGWRGDAYVATENKAGDTWCFVDEVLFQTPSDVDRATAFLKPWTDRARVTVERRSPTHVLLSGCRHG